MAKGSMYVVANWKMNPQTQSEAKELCSSYKKMATRLSRTTLVLCPPSIFLPILSGVRGNSNFSFGVQNVHHARKGAFTGEESVEMAESMGATHVLVGHSERRALGERDEEVNEKVKRVVSCRMNAIVCVGESDRGRDGEYLSFLERQITQALQGVSQKDLKYIAIAYEPIWAIGKTSAEAMKAPEVYETVLFIQKVLVGLYEKASALKVPILYGGSVEEDNCAMLLKEGGVNGFLVGHASLDPHAFGAILQTVDSFKGVA